MSSYTGSTTVPPLEAVPPTSRSPVGAELAAAVKVHKQAKNAETTTGMNRSRLFIGGPLFWGAPDWRL